MPIDYTGTNAGLFVRLGKLVNAGKEERISQGTLLTHIEEAMGKYTATSIDRTEYLGDLAGDRNQIVDEAGRNAQEAVRDAMQRTIIEQLDAELTPRLEPAKTIDNALRRLTLDMRAQSQAIGTTAINFSGVTNASTTFDGTIIMADNAKFSNAGVKGAAVVSNDTVLAETINARCLQDSKDGGLIAGNERFEVTGENAIDRLDRRWPRGSGCNLQLHSTCGDIDSSGANGQNMLTNSSFERRNSTPFPLDWTPDEGTIGTDLLSGVNGARGAYSLKFKGDGTNERSVYQIMGEGPRVRIKSNTCYVISAWLRAETADINDGTVSFLLADKTGAVIGNCFATLDMGSSTVFTSIWRHFTGYFTTPLDLPSLVRFYIRTGTSGGVLLNNALLLIDEVVLAQVNVLYPGGPGCVIVPGTADFQLSDEMSVAITKTQNEWSLELDRYLDIASKDIRFPTASGTNTTIATTLIA